MVACRGAGHEPLLLVHGALSYAAKFRPLAQRLAPHYSCVCLLDLPGFGVAPPLCPSSIDAAAAFVSRARSSQIKAQQQRTSFTLSR